MSTPGRSAWAARVAVRELADALIPGADGMPSPEEIGLADAQLDLVLEALPHLAEPLQRIRLGKGTPAALIERLAAEDPEAHEALCLAVAGGYYTHADVRRRLGYDGQQPVEVRAEIIPGYVEEGLIDPVLERGERFRPAPP